MYLTCVLLLLCEKIQKQRKPEDVFLREKKQKKRQTVEREKTKKQSKERFLTSQRTHLTYHRILLIHYFNKEEEEKNVPIYAFNKVTSDRTERLYERDDEKTRDKEERKRREFSRENFSKSHTLTERRHL